MSTATCDFDRVKPTMQCAAAAAWRAYWAAMGEIMAYSVDHCSEIETNQKDRKEWIQIWFYFSLTLSNYLHQPPFLWGTLFQVSSTLP